MGQLEDIVKLLGLEPEALGIDQEEINRRKEKATEDLCHAFDDVVGGCGAIITKMRTIAGSGSSRITAGIIRVMGVTHDKEIEHEMEIKGTRIRTLLAQAEENILEAGMLALRLSDELKHQNIIDCQNCKLAEEHGKLKPKKDNRRSGEEYPDGVMSISDEETWEIIRNAEEALTFEDFADGRQTVRIDGDPLERFWNPQSMTDEQLSTLGLIREADGVIGVDDSEDEFDKIMADLKKKFGGKVQVMKVNGDQMKEILEDVPDEDEQEDDAASVNISEDGVG